MRTIKAESPGLSSPGQLTAAKIGAVYAPVALSWLLMMLDTQIVTGFISRRPSPSLNTSALFVLLGLVVLFDAPIADLTTTATTLARNLAHHREVRHFALILLSAVTGIHALVTFTPLYWVVAEHVLGRPHEFAVVARLPLMCTVLWPACIGWRRYCQGVLIGSRRTKQIAAGTLIRLTSLSIVAYFLFRFTDLSGIGLGGIALMSGVLAETLFIHVVATAHVRNHLFDLPDGKDVEPLGMRRMIRFHLPLTLSSVIITLSNLIVAAALARMPDPTLRTAAFQVGTGLLWVTTSYVAAMPEVVITLYKSFGELATLRRFCIGIGLSATALLLLLDATGIDRLYFAQVLGAPAYEIPIAQTALLACAAVPLLMGVRSYMYALLTAHHRTFPRLFGTCSSTLVLAATLTVGVRLQANGVIAASAATTLALVAEVSVLIYAWNAGRTQVRLATSI